MLGGTSVTRGFSCQTTTLLRSLSVATRTSGGYREAGEIVPVVDAARSTEAGMPWMSVQ